MKRASKTSKAIPAVLLVLVAIAVSNWAFAQGGSISGSVKDLSSNQGIEGVTITVNDASTSALVGTTTTDASGNYLVGIPSLGNYALLASKPGYDSMSAPDVIELSDTTPHRIVIINMSQKAFLKYKPKVPKPVLSWETGAGKSYLIPALEIPGFLLTLNGFDRLYYGDDEDTYDTTLSTFWDHLVHGGWQFDKDAFETSQIAHMYSGTIYYGFARSAGLNFWESSVYTFLGSLLWELGGETTPPSVNDQVTSGIAGILVGEPLFRMASLLLEGGGKPGFWRELGAALISPPTGFNRLVFGDRFKTVFPSHDPAVFQRVRLGASVNTKVSDRGGSGTVNRTEATADYSMTYGLPGKPSYSYTRPFDYFQFEFTGTSTAQNHLPNFMTRGLLLGKKYEAGNTYRGVWGLYGSFDYAYLPSFCIWSTAASLGTTAQWWLAPAVALQGTALGGMGYGWSGNVSENSETDYHYGAAGQGLLALRLIHSDVAMLDATGSQYYISDVGSTKTRGRETIDRLNVGLTVRIYGHHALGIQYNAWNRDAHFPYRADSQQREETFSFVYTLLSDTRFGVVEWRDASSR